ncbi:MAG: ABC transporter ATP-binding protein/permease [Symbiobacteriaceae bacterium]|nr:ABC transporter ATP-binding protein/permease [Symbiobacteriaceae bacterium]
MSSTVDPTQERRGLAAALRIFSFVRPYGFVYVLSLTCYAGQTFFLSYILSMLIGGLSAAMLAVEREGIYRSTGIYILWMLAGMLLVGWGCWAFSLCVEQSRRDLKVRLFRAFIRTGSEQSSGLASKGVSALNTEANLAAQIFGSALFFFAMHLAAIVLSALVIFTVDLRLGAISLVVGSLSLGVQYRFAEPLSRLSREKLNLTAATVSRINNFISGGSIIRAYELQSREEEGFATYDRSLLHLNLRESLISLWQDLFANLQSWVTIVGIFGLGGLLVARGELELPSLLMVPPLAAAITSGMAQIGKAWANLQGPIAACERLGDILAQDERLLALGATSVEAEAVWDEDATLRLDHLNFAYLDSEVLTLKDISLEIKPLEMVALVGKSGCGKSTLLRLIIGIYDRMKLPLSLGSLAYSHGNSAWRSLFAYVDQSSTLFDLTIAENIALGKTGCSLQEIETAAREAGALEFIQNLPHGFATPCGEKGAALSGSQKQRIAIARALVRQAPVLVFDEVTSMLDAEAAVGLQQTIEALRKKHSIIIVSHNLEQIQGADRIVVIDEGSIVQDGPHMDLLSQEGVYATLWQQQKEVAS